MSLKDQSLRRRNLILHPVLFSLYPIFAVISTNSSFVFYIQGWRAIIVFPLITLLFMFLLNYWIKNWHRTAFLVTLGIIFILYFGPFYRVLKGITIGGVSIDNQIILLVIWTVFLVFLGSKWIWNQLKNPARISRTLNIISIIAIFIPLITTIKLTYLIRQDPLTAWKRPAFYDKTISLPPTMDIPPDIYYIILDGYARRDVLEDIYGFDNHEFLGLLEDNGFYVAQKSRANYVRTSMSLASSLNMEHITYLEDVGKETANWFPLREMIQNNQVSHLLKGAGYRTVAMSSGYFHTEMRKSDVYLSRFKVNINDFEQLLLASSIFDIAGKSGILDLPTFGYDTHRKTILYQLEQLKEVPEISGPKFVFAHLVLPHPPFIFDQFGNEKEPDSAYLMADGTDYEGTLTEYLEGYIAQLQYTNDVISEVIEAIINNSSNPPIIVLQADHGPGAYLDWNSIENTWIKERFSILNAYYMPGYLDQSLYDTISPVNTFRVIFNTYFLTKFELLPDNSYYSTANKPYQFVDVTNISDSNKSCPSE
jgi:hypothetical protein